MGTHPIFESDFDCLTDQNGEKREGKEEWEEGQGGKRNAYPRDGRWRRCRRNDARAAGRARRPNARRVRPRARRKKLLPARARQNPHFLGDHATPAGGPKSRASKQGPRNGGIRGATPGRDQSLQAKGETASLRAPERLCRASNEQHERAKAAIGGSDRARESSARREEGAQGRIEDVRTVASRTRQAARRRPRPKSHRLVRNFRSALGRNRLQVRAKNEGRTRHS